MNDFLTKLANEILNPIIYLAFSLALILFLYGVLGYIRNAGDPEKRKEGANHILWGIIGLVIMFGVQRIMQIVTGTFF